MLSSNKGVEGVAPAGGAQCHPDGAHHEGADGVHQCHDDRAHHGGADSARHRQVECSLWCL